jgi:hypothetical protein
LTDRVRVERSGAASATNGYANTGVHIGDVNLITGVPVMTRYIEQVRRIVPTELIGRETELAELRSFCTAAETASSYLWCLAPAWSGKSSLMSWLVTHPPQGVRIVSFFITARWAGQSDRNAFIDNVLEQLVTVLGKDMPTFLRESNREPHLLGLLTEAAEACAARGERLVLLVDGLDEDRGVTAGPDAHSIAALLPIAPAHGLRVIVASRPSPPLPGDVRADHPLRNPGVFWPLAAYRGASQVRDEMENELHRLLEGTAVEQDLLGLLTASGGGLTATDLAELGTAGLSTWRIERNLRAVAGRSFTRRGSVLAPGSLPDSYVLGHEELHATAERMLGDGNLRRHRDRLHAWAEQYRDRGWPSSTPEYLLHGYHALLAQHDDLPRMIEYATDPARHDRQLSTGGTDRYAAVENIATQQMLVARTPVDPRAWVRLALHLDRVRNRGNGMPPAVSQGWAKLGQLDRAELLAREAVDSASLAYGLAGVAAEAWPRGDAARSRRLIAEVVAIAEAEDRAFTRNHHVGALVWAASRADDWRVVEDALAGVSDPNILLHALLVAAHTAAEGAETARALSMLLKASDLAEKSFDAHWKVEALASIANEAALAGARDGAKQFLRQAEALAGSSEPQQQVSALVMIARVAIASGVTDPWPTLAAAEQLARADEQGDHAAAALASISIALSEMGDTQRAVVVLDAAERALRGIDNKARRDGATRAVVVAAVAAGLIDRALSTTAAIPDDLGQVQALQNAIRQARHGQDLDAAERLARMMPMRASWNSALAGVAVALIEAGDHDCGRDMLREVESSVRQETRFTDPEALLDIARSEAKAGHVRRADRIATTFLPADQQVTALQEITLVCASRPEPEAVDRLLVRAEELLPAASRGWNGASGFISLAATAMAANRPATARRLAAAADELANAYTDQELRVEALSATAATALSAGLDHHGRQLLERARSISCTLQPCRTRRRTFAAVAAAAATQGDLDAVDSFLLTSGESYYSLRLSCVVKAAVGKVDYETMHRLLNLISPRLGGHWTRPDSRLHASATVAAVAVEVGRRAEAAYFLRDVVIELATLGNVEPVLLPAVKAAIGLGRRTLARTLLSSMIGGNSAAATAEVALLAYQLDMTVEYFDVVGTLLNNDRWSSATIALRAVDPTITQLVAEELVRIS